MKVPVNQVILLMDFTVFHELFETFESTDSDTLRVLPLSSVVVVIVVVLNST